jgi:hypothetical protein
LIHGPLPEWVDVVATGLRRHPQFVDLRATP